MNECPCSSAIPYALSPSELRLVRSAPLSTRNCRPGRCQRDIPRPGTNNGVRLLTWAMSMRFHRAAMSTGV